MNIIYDGADSYSVMLESGDTVTMTERDILNIADESAIISQRLRDVKHTDRAVDTTENDSYTS